MPRRVREKSSGHLFQDRYKSEPVENDIAKYPLERLTGISFGTIRKT